MNHDEKLLGEIEKLRSKMIAIAQKRGSLLDANVLQISQELDQLIALKQRQIVIHDHHLNSRAVRIGLA